MVNPSLPISKVEMLPNIKQSELQNVQPIPWAGLKGNLKGFFPPEYKICISMITRKCNVYSFTLLAQLFYESSFKTYTSNRVLSVATGKAIIIDHRLASQKDLTVWCKCQHECWHYDRFVRKCHIPRSSCWLSDILRTFITGLSLQFWLSHFFIICQGELPAKKQRQLFTDLPLNFHKWISHYFAMNWFVACTFIFKHRGTQQEKKSESTIGRNHICV